MDSLRLDSFQLDDLTLSDDQTVLASVRMFVDSGHVERFKIDLKVNHAAVCCSFGVEWHTTGILDDYRSVIV